MKQPAPARTPRRRRGSRETALYPQHIPTPSLTPTGLVLSGGGTRGAYELGALSVLLPALAERGESPRILVGTSAGALNTAFLAANVHRPLDAVIEDWRGLWSHLRWDQILDPLLSPGALARLAPFAALIAGLDDPRPHSLLDPAPLARTLRERVSFERIERNVGQGRLDAVAVVATSAFTSRSVVFHSGGQSPARDQLRGIDYAATALDASHVLASAAIPATFPAVHVEQPAPARGWYYDGGSRLNTPIKPALALGAGRVVVIALNSLAPAPAQLASEREPDVFDGTSQLMQAVLVDPLVADVRTLAHINTLVGPDDQASGRRRVPYLLVAPATRDAIGSIAAEVFREHYAGLGGLTRDTDVSLVGRLVAGGSDAVHGELLSFLFLAPEFARRLIELGAEDAARALGQTHADGPWRIDPPEDG